MCSCPRLIPHTHTTVFKDYLRVEKPWWWDNLVQAARKNIVTRSQHKENIKHWGGCATTAEDYSRVRSCLPRSRMWHYHELRSHSNWWLSILFLLTFNFGFCVCGKNKDWPPKLCMPQLLLSYTHTQVLRCEARQRPWQFNYSAHTICWSRRNLPVIFPVPEIKQAAILKMWVWYGGNYGLLIYYNISGLSEPFSLSLRIL